MLCLSIKPAEGVPSDRPLFIKTLPFMAASCHRHKNPDVFIAADPEDPFVLQSLMMNEF